MADSTPRILITSALPYANGPVHVGHVAGAYLPGDIYARYQRLQGRDVLYICGSDEHGVPIMLRARKEGATPQAVVDRYHAMIRDAFAAVGMSFDYYGRTSSATHRETSQEFFRTLAKGGRFVRRTEAQLYDPEAQLFLADRLVRGTCPTCGYEDAYGDQCERCGRTLSPTELIDPRSAITNATPELRETTHWYLPLAEHQAWLEGWIGQHEGWKTNVLGQVRSWLSEGLVDRAMSRDLPWGVPFPEEIGREAGVDVSGKVLYVWFEAPIGYISASREWAKLRGEPERWRDYWQRSDTRLVHFIGKDNIVFHCIIFPIMLELHGEYVLPQDVPANEFLNLKGEKLSTSRSVAVWLHDVLQSFPPDYLRYTLTAIMPETRDSDFSWEVFQARVNNELADTLGNFINRTVTFARNYFDGKVPPLVSPSAVDTAMLASLAGYPGRIGELVETYRFRDAMAEAMSLARAANKYFTDCEPWKTRKADPVACANTIHVSLQIGAALSILLDPFLPFSTVQMRTMLGLTGVRQSGPATPDAAPAELSWADAGRPLLASGQPLGEPVILFSKVDAKAIAAHVDGVAPPSENASTERGSGKHEPETLAHAALGETIEYGDFAKLDLRVGVVTEAHEVPNSKKLVRCIVDLGFETRQVLAGVAQHLTPAQLQGQKVIVVANLAPRTMMGLVSHGMLLMAEDRQGRLVPVTAPSEPGSSVK
jgi:methionyl-tRNA synthetase